MRWYFPSWAGDFRLLPDDDETARLEVEKPTPSEVEALNKFLVFAGKKGWVDKGTKLPDAEEGYRGSKEKQTLDVAASVAVAGKALLRYIKPKRTTLTAVRFEGGQVEVAESADESGLATMMAEATAIEKETKQQAKAASTSRPTPCCPQCIPGSVDRASEVLLSFLNEDEHRQWAERRAIVVTGHLSGHRYLVCHRHSELAQRFGRMCFDLSDEGVMHFHDWSVPPEEEVLAVKFMMEHREPWLRNEATCLGPIGLLSGTRATHRIVDLDPTLGHGPRLSREPVCDVTGVPIAGASNTPFRTWRDIFKNPFGGGMDGVADASFTAQIGSFAEGFLGTLSALGDDK